MKSVCKSLMFSTLLAVAALLPNQLLGQSKPEPAVVVSISNLDEQFKDVKYLLDASGFAGFDMFVLPTIQAFTAGIDEAEDIGVMLYFSEMEAAAGPPIPKFLAFVPVTDLEEWLDALSNTVDVEENDNGTVSILTNDGTELTLKEKDGYAFIANEPELLNDLPEAPKKELGDLPEKFNLALKVLPGRVPESLRKQALTMIEEGAMQTLDQLEDELQDLQAKNLEMQLKQFKMMLNESESLVVGMAADEESKKLVTEVTYIARAGTDLAKKMNEVKATTPSRFTGFLMEGAAMNFTANARVAADDGKMYGQLLADGKKSLIDELNEESELSDSEFEKVESAIDSLVEVIAKTLENGVVNGGAVVMLEGKDINFATGMTVAEPAKLESVVKDLIPILKQKAGDDDVELEINLDHSQHAGVTFHQIKVMIDEDEEDARRAFGDSVSVQLGIGEDTLYFGAGNDPLPLIKKAMAGKSSSDYAAEMNFFLVPVLRSAAGLGAPPEVGAMAEALSESGGDRIRMVAEPIENGSTTRFEMQDGILSLIKVGFEAFQGGRGAFDDDF